MQLLSAKFAQIASQIDATNAQITALQTYLSELQEHQQQLLSVEQACQSALSQADTALIMLNHVDPSQIETFKDAMLAKFVPGTIGILEAVVEPDESELDSMTPDAPIDPNPTQETDSIVSNPEHQTPPESPAKPAKQSAADKKLDSIFGERTKEKEQFLTVKNELTALGITVGRLINSRSDAKGWNLNWGKDKAALYWTVGNGWEVGSRTPDTDLTGQWEDFDLTEQLTSNGIDFNEEID